MRKKWIAGLLAISMIAAMGGCSGAGTSSSSQKAKESSAGESSVAEESSETEENQSENSSEAEKNADTANQSKVLFEDSTARITYTGTDEESWMGKGLKVTIENLSDKNITVQTRETSVNGVMDDPYFSCDVASGKTANDTIYFSSKDDLGTIELSFHIVDSDTYDTIADTEKVTLVIDDSITSEKTEADKIYESNGVVVSYAGKVEAVQQNANLQSLHRHCLLSPIFSRNSISHFLAIVNNKKTGSTAGDFLFCTAGFLLVIYFICRQISRKLSTLTYPVTYFPAGVLPQYSLRVVIRKRPSLHCLPS